MDGVVLTAGSPNRFRRRETAGLKFFAIRVLTITLNHFLGDIHAGNLSYECKV
jgi:hypothetical protein